MQRHLVNPERTCLAVEARNLTKYYGSLLAVDHISFEVREGEIFGFLGPNGAGKTTTIRMLCGLSKISDGTAYV
ncbi:MAG: ABC transporter ATP-binding protein, partial [Thermoproteota archaeon]